jgi:hypothetical protein
MRGNSLSNRLKKLETQASEMVDAERRRGPIVVTLRSQLGCPSFTREEFKDWVRNTPPLGTPGFDSIVDRQMIAAAYLAGRSRSPAARAWKPGDPPPPPDELVPFEQTAQAMDEALCQGAEEAIRFLDSVYAEKDFKSPDEY